MIRQNDGVKVSKILKDAGGLYQLQHGISKALTAEEVIPLEKFHHCMGNISPEVAQKLVTKGLVTGICLNTSAGKDFFCESCIYAKSMWRPIAKVCQGECTKDFAEEIHSNIWGPAPVATITG